MKCSYCGKIMDAVDIEGQELCNHWFPDAEPQCCKCAGLALGLPVEDEE